MVAAVDSHAGKSSSTRSLREQRHFDELADKQGEAWWGHLAPAGKPRSRRRANLVVSSACFSSGETAVEIGCGAGFFTSNYVDLLPNGVHVVAVDISPKMIDRALSKPDLSARTNLRFEVQNVEALTYADESFDAVFGSSILHHLDLPQSLPELHRVLKPGGRFVFAEPNALNPLISLEKYFRFGRNVEQTSEDERAINRFLLARQLEDHGFECVRLQPYDFLHPNTPARLHAILRFVGAVCERIPLFRELAGSLLIVARKA